ncbi:MAG: formylglycine-generating enzyme family protein, partial [Verrucomicrobiales bacterium]|nr:formylglycine-generating enzyme family protein [Verrucomicrobiales bacterium]
CVMSGGRRPGEGAADTKRIEQLERAAPDDISQKLVKIMSASDARLLTADDTGVEITHEALIRSWGELRKWVERDRKWILVEQRLAEDAKHWNENGEKSKFLYSGARLEDAKEWLKRNRKAAEQFRLEMRFVKRSVARANRRLQLMVTATIGSLALAFAAFWITERALDSREQAYVKDAEGALALAKVAKMEGNVYPDQIFHKARAIGFAGFGREESAETGWKQALQTRLDLLLGREEPFPVLLKSNPERFTEATEDLAATPACLPFWRSEPTGMEVKSIAVSEDGNQVTAAFADGTVTKWDLSQPDPTPVQQKAGTEWKAVPVPVELLSDSVKVSIPGEDITLKQPGKPVAAGLDFVRSNLYIGLADGSLVGWNISGRPVGEGREVMEYFDEKQGWAAFAKNSTEILLSPEAQPSIRTDVRAAIKVGEFPKDPVLRDKYTNGIGMEMVFLPPGKFQMGSPENKEDRLDDEVLHEVELTRGFWLGKYEVTQRAWIAVMGENPSSFPNLNAPVEKVSWNDVTKFCEILTEREWNAGRLPANWQYALPTEAQWEYACRAGTETPFFWGKTLNGKRANCDGTNPYGTVITGPYIQRTATVGSYQPNPWGLYDMHGNVYEWCLDWYGEYEVGKPDPQGPVSGENRVMRGGSWFDLAGDCRSALRLRNNPEFSDFDIGFRVATVPKQPEAERTERTTGGAADARDEPAARREAVE